MGDHELTSDAAYQNLLARISDVYATGQYPKGQKPSDLLSWSHHVELAMPDYYDNLFLLGACYFQVCFLLLSAIFLAQKCGNGKKTENRANTPVPMGCHGRYYSYSKPGGPLSQDTHTSSGLSIYGLGVGT